jgi:hypothetical protein
MFTGPHEAKLLAMSLERLLRELRSKFGCLRRASSDVKSNISAPMLEAIIRTDGSSIASETKFRNFN